MEKYDNNYMSEHSNYLKEYFTISNRGVDYYNLNNVSFEFKESFAEKRCGIFFKIPEQQLKESMFFVFSIHNEIFYIVRSSELHMRYFCKGSKKVCYPRLHVIEQLCFHKTDNIYCLKIFIDKLKLDDV
jgi:hypothetical protein